MRTQDRQFDAGDLPDGVEIDTEIVVYDAVTKAGDLEPRNLGMRRLELRAHFVGGFASYGQLPENCVVGDGRGLQIQPCQGLADTVRYRGGGFDDV